MTKKPSGPLRLLRVLGLALIAVLAAWAGGDVSIGVLAAGVIIVGELIWVSGAFALRSLQRHRSRA